MLAQSTPSQVATAFGLPPAKKCVSRRKFPITLFTKGVKIKKARVLVNGKAVKVRKVSGRFKATVDLRGLPKGRFTVKITITTSTGRKLKGQRAYRTCAPRKT